PLLQDRRGPGWFVRHSRSARGQVVALRLRTCDYRTRRSDREETCLPLSTWIEDLQHCHDRMQLALPPCRDSNQNGRWGCEAGRGDPCLRRAGIAWQPGGAISSIGRCSARKQEVRHVSTYTQAPTRSLAA